MRTTRRRDPPKNRTRRKDFKASSGQGQGQGNVVAGDGPGRISLLKHKLEALRQRALVAVQSGDVRTKSWLDAEVAQLNATILRAETVVARLFK